MLLHFVSSLFCVSCRWAYSVLSCELFTLTLISVLSTLRVCFVCVCIGRYCRSTCSCCISCEEHEPPRNAQKHQHWWHQHKSAKFTVLQIAATRSWTCRCQPVFTVMQCVYQNFILLLIKNTISKVLCDLTLLDLLCFYFIFLKSCLTCVFVHQVLKHHIYLSLKHSFCLGVDLHMAFICYIADPCLTEMFI